MTEKLLNKHFHLVSPCDLDLWPSYPKIYTAVLQVIIYQLAKYEKDPMNNDREIGGRRWWERRKISKKEKTLQQQKGLPTLSGIGLVSELFGPTTYIGNIFSKFRVINGEYIVKISKGIVALVYEVKPFGFLVWHKIHLNNIEISRL